MFLFLRSAGGLVTAPTLKGGRSEAVGYHEAVQNRMQLPPSSLLSVLALEAPTAVLGRPGEEITQR